MASAICSEDEIHRIIAVIGNLTPEYWADTCQTLIGLLAVTGMRVGETVHLDSDDFDFDDVVLTIRNTKFGKSRQVPPHPTTVGALCGYAVPA